MSINGEPSGPESEIAFRVVEEAKTGLLNGAKLEASSPAAPDEASVDATPPAVQAAEAPGIPTQPDMVAVAGGIVAARAMELGSIAAPPLAEAASSTPPPSAEVPRVAEQSPEPDNQQPAAFVPNESDMAAFDNQLSSFEDTRPVSADDQQFADLLKAGQEKAQIHKNMSVAAPGEKAQTAIKEIHALDGKDAQERGKSRFGARPEAKAGAASSEVPAQDVEGNEASPPAAAEIVKDIEGRERQNFGEAGGIRSNPDGSIDLVMGSNMDAGRTAQLAELFNAATKGVRESAGQPTGEYRSQSAAAESARQSTRAERSPADDSSASESARQPTRDSGGFLGRIKSMTRRIFGIKPALGEALRERYSARAEQGRKQRESEYKQALGTAKKEMNTLKSWAKEVLNGMPDVEQHIQEAADSIEGATASGALLENSKKKLSEAGKEMEGYAQAIGSVREALRENKADLAKYQEEAKSFASQAREVRKQMLDIVGQFKELNRGDVQKLTEKLTNQLLGLPAQDDSAEPEESGVDSEEQPAKAAEKKESPAPEPEAAAVAAQPAAELSDEEPDKADLEPATLTIPLVEPLGTKQEQADTWAKIQDSLNGPSVRLPDSSVVASA